MDDRDDEFERGIRTVEREIAEFEEELRDVEPVEMGSEARRLDRERTTTERMRLPLSTLRRLALLGVVYVVGLAAMLPLFDAARPGLPLVPTVVAVAFAFELMDSAAGMGFGTALAPLLFVLGYTPLQVTATLLISESVTGLVSGGVHHELENVRFSLRPPNDEMEIVLLLGGVGGLASVASIVLVYFALRPPASFVETYVAVLVLLMGLVGLVRARTVQTIRYRPRRLAAFAFLAGVNKGVGGGGFGPVVTLGQILSGVYEKSATAIASLAESVVSLVGVVTFFVLTTQGVAVDLTLLPSIYTGGFVAAVGAPYLVRVVPNAVWRYVIPLYAFGIGVLGLTAGLGL
ncbi:TSUP family transporter [Halomicrococcus sp. NG-SE-24]|uniref:TSUP family transporter n=1 Tax=Halomicrococcus sp. NG-SE-24 TaxID=3436928 RepID=UPI003D990457